MATAAATARTRPATSPMVRPAGRAGCEGNRERAGPHRLRGCSQPVPAGLREAWERRVKAAVWQQPSPFPPPSCRERAAALLCGKCPKPLTLGWRGGGLRSETGSVWGRRPWVHRETSPQGFVGALLQSKGKPSGITGELCGG